MLFLILCFQLVLLPTCFVTLRQSLSSLVPQFPHCNVELALFSSSSAGLL